MDELDKAIEVLCRNLFVQRMCRQQLQNMYRGNIQRDHDGLTASFS